MDHLEPLKAHIRQNLKALAREVLARADGALVKSDGPLLTAAKLVPEEMKHRALSITIECVKDASLACAAAE